jgi:hypothetical protein
MGMGIAEETEVIVGGERRESNVMRDRDRQREMERDAGHAYQHLPDHMLGYMHQEDLV